MTLEFLEECIQGLKIFKLTKGFYFYNFDFLGFRQSSIELKHLCLEYMTPWLSNLPRFCKLTGDDVKRQKVSVILDRLVTMTIEEFEVRLGNYFIVLLIIISFLQMYPSIQAKIWGNMGRVSELLDLILDCFIKV